MFLASTESIIAVRVCILCRYMKEAAASSEKDDGGSQDVTETLSAEKVGMSKTVRFLSSVLPSVNLLKMQIEFRDELP